MLTWLEVLHSSTNEIQSKLYLHSHWSTHGRDWCMFSTMIMIKTQSVQILLIASMWTKQATIPIDSSGQRATKRIHTKEDVWARSTISSRLNTLFIRPGIISSLCTHCNNKSAVTQLHFLASWTSFGRKRKSTKVFQGTQKWKFC